MRDNQSVAISDAMTALQQGQHARAERLLRRVIASDPGHVPALMILGTLYGQRGHSEQAAAQFERVIALHPDSADAHYNLGMALADRSKARALTAIGRRLRQNRDTVMRLTTWRRSCWCCNAGMKRLRCLSSLAERVPGDPLLLSKLGIALKERGRLDEAIAVLKQAIRAQPAEATTRANLGIALWQAGRLDEAGAVPTGQGGRMVAGVRAHRRCRALGSRCRSGHGARWPSELHGFRCRLRASPAKCVSRTAALLARSRRRQERQRTATIRSARHS